MVHVSSTMWRIKNQASNSTSCSDDALLRLLVLVAGKSYRGLNLSDVFISNLELRFEGLFWDHGHTGRPSQKHQPYEFSGNTGLEFQLAGVAGYKLPPSSNHSSSSSQLKSQAMYFRRIRRVDVFGDWSCWGFWCGPCMREEYRSTIVGSCT